MVGALRIAGCGDGSAEVPAGDDPAETTTGASQTSGVHDGFRLVGEEEVGLNGAENEGRPPLHYLLLADEAGSSTEEQMVDRYVEQLIAGGWDMTEWAESDDWWTAEGNDGTALVRVGPASSFHELATISEGYSRTTFRNLAAENPEPLIVVSTDPAG